MFPGNSNRLRQALVALLLLGWLSPPILAADLDGIWKGDYNGTSVIVEGRTVRVYQTSASFSLFIQQAELSENDTYQTSSGAVYSVAITEGKLVFSNDRGEPFLHLSPVPSLPPLITLSDDPLLAFDVFWEFFHENYSHFELTGTDWQAMYSTWRPSAAGASPAKLFDIFSSMIAPLNDRHTAITRTEPIITFRSGPERDPFWQGRENEFLNNINQNYLAAPLQTRFLDPRMRFGILPGNIGYLSISNFLDFNGVTFGTTLDVMLSEMTDTAGLVVDLRFNPGGASSNVLAFMERVLTPGSEFAYAQQIRHSTALPASFTDVSLQAVQPFVSNVHQRPISILTSQNSASGAEIALLPMLYEPRVVQVGESTRGVFSKLLFLYLPNGWQATLSNERVYSLEGVSYEQQGVPPLLPVTQDAYDLSSGVDAGLDRAIDSVQAQPAAIEMPFDTGQSISGLWYDPTRDGEGWHIQRVNENSVFVSFYSYDPDDASKRLWFVGLGSVEDQRVVIDRLVVTEGGQFGAGPGDEPGISERDWGRAVITFADCEEAIAEVAGPDRFRGFVYRLQRLSELPGLGCNSQPVPGVTNASMDGAWFVSARPGEGWLVSHSGPGTAVVTWYTFDHDGNPLWLVGLGEISESGELFVEEMFEASGALYGWNFVAGDVVLQPYGSLAFSLLDCSQGMMVFTATAGGEPIQFDVDRLLYVDGVDYRDDCI